MKHKFLNFFLDKKDLSSQNMEMIDPILVENNKNELQKFFEFYQNDNPILFINGFLGTGKAQLTNYSLNFLDKETIVLKYNCFETTILDDIFLSFFSEFKRLQAQNIIINPKVKSENFTQKILSYFKEIEKPFLIILDSFETLTEENRKTILKFLLHLNSFNKVKTILIGRTFKSSFLPSHLSVDRITTNPIERTLFEKFLKNKKVKANSNLLNSFYKNTRGYYYYTNLSLKIIESKDIDLEIFLTNFQKSFTNFFEYLEKESLDIIPAISVRLFWLLCLLRHSISVTLLKQLGLYDEKTISTFISNDILTIENGQVYVQDYFKEQINISIPQNVEQKLHQMIIDIYNAQLPLKPSERAILISRQTMRKEIEYHSLFIPKKVDLPEKNNLAFVTYTKEQPLDIKKETTAKEEWVASNENSETGKAGMSSILNNIDLDINDLPFELTPQEMALLGCSVPKSAESIPIIEPKNDTPQEDNKKEKDSTPSLKEILEIAKVLEHNYEYLKVTEVYKQALDYTDDVDYKANLPLIYTKLGFAYQKMSDWNNAIKYYELAREIYEKTGEKVKENYINYNIATIYYETFKIDEAKTILKGIINTENCPAILITKAYMSIANIDDSTSNLSEAATNYWKAYEYSNPTMDVETLSELYFKCALISDDKNDEKTAMEFYQKCIDVSSDSSKNKLLSAAYSNLATINYEKRDVDTAIKYYLKAYEIDKQYENYDGMYYSAVKLAQALQKQYPNKALEYFINAKEYAKKLDDNFYIASASLSLGDFYYYLKENEKALQEYFWAYNIAKKNFSKDNLNKIQMRIDDIKFKLGDIQFSRLEAKFNNGK